MDSPPIQPAVRQPDPVRTVIVLWVVLRIGLSLWAFVVARTSGTSDNLLTAWLRWDAEWFVQIARHGYQADDGTTSFHPLFPALGWLIGSLLGGRMLLGLMLVSSLASLGTLVALARLAALDLPPATVRRAVVFFAVLPVSFVLFAPYTESLFLLWSILAFLAARRGRWWQAAACAALATLTRQQGLFLLIPLAWELWEASGRRWRYLRLREAASLLLVPLAMLGWLVFRGLAFSDVSWNLHQPRTLVYSLLISRSSTKVVPVQGFLPPWEALWTAIRVVVRGPLRLPTVVDLAVGGAMLAIILGGARHLVRLRLSYLLYSLVIVLVSFSYSTGPVAAYMGLPRHLLLAFPLVFPLAVWGEHRLIRRVTLVVGTSGLSMLLLLSSKWLWCP